MYNIKANLTHLFEGQTDCENYMQNFTVCHYMTICTYLHLKLYGIQMLMLQVGRPGKSQLITIINHSYKQKEDINLTKALKSGKWEHV